MKGERKLSALKHDAKHMGRHPIGKGNPWLQHDRTAPLPMTSGKQVLSAIAAEEPQEEDVSPASDQVSNVTDAPWKRSVSLL